MTAARILFAACLALGASACTQLLPERAAPRLFTLTAPDVPMATVERAVQLTIERGPAGPGLGTDRILLRTSPTDVDYFADAAWTEPSPQLVQTILLTAFERSGGLQGVARGGGGVRSDYALLYELREMHAFYPNGDFDQAPTIRVALSARLIDTDSREVVASRNFSADAPAQSPRLNQVVGAMDQALDRVVLDVVSWTLERLPAR